MYRVSVAASVRAALAAAALTLAACETAAPPPPAPPPPPPPPPAISLAPRVIELASTYQAYVRRASNISPSFVNEASVTVSLQEGVSYQPAQLASGQIAYAAVVALQDPTFVADVRRYAVSERQRVQIRDQILRDPAYAVGFKGSDTAAGLIVAALNGEGSRVRSVGQSVKQAAYDVQRQEWSKARIPTPELRLAQAKNLSEVRSTASAEDVARLTEAALGRQSLGLTGQSLPPPYTPAVIRGLAVAALAALGEGGEANAAYLDALVNDPNNGHCLNMSKLNLYQCLAVAKPWYEDVFCLGQHVLIDTGQCIVKASGDLPAPVPALAPVAPAMTPIPTSAAAPSAGTGVLAAAGQ